jgi:type 1 glutamine amidotransferase
MWLRRLPAVVFAAVSLASAADPKVLVYTRNHVTNGKGYVHDNIAASVEAIRKMGAENHFQVDVSDDPKTFTAANLKQYRAIVFSNSNNEAFENDEQRDALKAYIHAGGGFVGIHSATGSERKWPWYWSMIGGTFQRHPKMQPFLVQVVDPKHPAAAKLPPTFEWTDECYYHKEMNQSVKLVLVTDPAKIQDPKMQSDPPTLFDGRIPLAWSHVFEGGRVFYTALGHKKEDYANPLLYNQILGGIQWAMGVKK